MVQVPDDTEQAMLIYINELNVAIPSRSDEVVAAFRKYRVRLSNINRIGLVIDYKVIIFFQ